MKNLIAQGVPIGNRFSGIGNIGRIDNPVRTLAQVISTTIGLLTVIGALYFMFNLISGAIGIISSGGDKAAYESARRKLTTGAIGFVAVVAGMFIMSLIALLLGLPNILNLQAMINAIRI